MMYLKSDTIRTWDATIMTVKGGIKMFDKEKFVALVSLVGDLEYYARVYDDDDAIRQSVRDATKDGTISDEEAKVLLQIYCIYDLE